MVANWQMEKTGLPYAFIMRKGSVSPVALGSRWQASSRPSSFEATQDSEPQITRQQALSAVVDNTPEDESIVVATTGYTGRELFAIADRPNQLYMVGSMGCASSFGLGLALALRNGVCWWPMVTGRLSCAWGIWLRRAPTAVIISSTWCSTTPCTNPPGAGHGEQCNQPGGRSVRLWLPKCGAGRFNGVVTTIFTATRGAIPVAIEAEIRRT